MTLFWPAGKNFFSKDHKCAVRKRLKFVESFWREIEKDILDEISSLLGMPWPEDKIKCYLVTNSVPFSDLLTVPLYEKNNEIFDVLIHELLHRMISGKNYRFTKESWKRFFEKYENESLKTKLHIPLHAIHKHIYLKFFGKSRLERDQNKNRESNNEDYKRSWEIVESEGYKNIIDEFRKDLVS